MMPPDLQLFLQAWTGDASLDESDHQRLLDRFRDDKTFREACLREIRILALCKTAQAPPPRWLGLMEALECQEPSEQECQSRFETGVMAGVLQTESLPRSRWIWDWRSRLRPLAAAAAGLMVGVLGASMVWAYTVPLWSRSSEQVNVLLREGFEAGDFRSGRGFPTLANHWSGDLEAMDGSESQIVPSEGGRLARLNPAPRRKMSYAWHIVDLAQLPPPHPGDLRQLEVSAAFVKPPSGERARFQIRLAAFSQEPGEIRAIWNNEPVLFESVLQHVGRNVHARRQDEGWQTVRASLDIPPETRCLLVSLAAGSRNDTQDPTPYFLDEVQIQIRTRPATY